jgi:hypothetical protein
MYLQSASDASYFALNSFSCRLQYQRSTGLLSYVVNNAVGFTINLNGDVVCHALTVNADLTVNGVLYPVSVNASGNINSAGAIGCVNYLQLNARYILQSDGANWARIWMDNANGCYLHLNWNTAKLYWYAGNRAVMSIDASGNLTILGSLYYTTAPTSEAEAAELAAIPRPEPLVVPPPPLKV